MSVECPTQIRVEKHSFRTQVEARHEKRDGKSIIQRVWVETSVEANMVKKITC